MLRKKIIGRQPTEHGEWAPGQAYGKKFIVTLFDCGWESKHDNNTSAPATLDAQTGTITENTTDWKKKWGSYEQWLIDNGYQKTDASNVKDGNNNQHQINASFANEIGSDSTPESIKGRITNLESVVGDGGSVDERIAEEGARHYLKSETYTKEEVNGMITTPNQEYVSVEATEQTTAATDVLPATGAADTIYRVANWDGSQYDASVYSEYAWNGTQYIHLSTKTQIGEVFDISAYHATGGTLATYTDLADALTGTNGGVPQSLQKGGMSIKFVHTSDNKYVQFRLMSQTFSTDVTDWQGVDEKPIAGSKNLINSDGVSKCIYHTYNEELNAIVKEIYIDESVASGYDYFSLNWYKTLGFYRISGVRGSETILLVQNIFENNKLYFVELITNGQTFGYMYIDTHNTVIEDPIYDVKLYNTKIAENPCIYSYLENIRISNKINKYVSHTYNDDINKVLKEIYIEESTASYYDEILFSWYDNVQYYRVIGVKDGVQTILQNDAWIPNSYSILNLEYNGNIIGIIILDTKEVPSDNIYEVPVFNMNLFDNPIIYSHILIDEKQVVNITATRNQENFNSIRDIVNSITDASEYKQYVINVPKGEWFECDLNGKKYVKIVGESRDETILYCDGTSTKRTPSDYSISAYQNTPLNEINFNNKHCIMQRFDVEITNLTVRITDAKYCIHVGASDLIGSDYHSLLAKNCVLIAGNANANCPVGIGADDYKAEFDNCIFENFDRGSIGVHIHNHPNANKSVNLRIINSLFKCNFLNIGELGSMQNDNVELINCYSNGNGEINYYVDAVLPWVNPSTGEREENPLVYPYCIKVNALGSNVNSVTDRIIGGNVTRPDSLKYIMTDHYISVPSTGLFVGRVVRGFINFSNQLYLLNDAPVIGVVEKIIDNVAYIAKKRVVLKYTELTAGQEGDLAYVDNNGKLTNIEIGNPIGVFDVDISWGMFKSVYLF